MTTILEAMSDSPSNALISNEETVDTEQSIVENQGSEVEATETPIKEVSSEPTVELDGEKVSLSDVKKWKQDYVNDSKWKSENQRRSEEIKKKERELMEYEFIKPLIQQRPEVLQQLIAPKPERNIDVEIQQLYNQRPDPYNVEEFARWEYAKDSLIAEKISQQSQQKFQAETQQRESFQHNENIGKVAAEKYVKAGKIGESDFLQLTDWIVNNIVAKNGKYPDDVYDIAYKKMYEGKWLEDVKLEATKKAVAPILKAKNGAGDNGVAQRSPLTTEQDEEDELFIQATQRFK